jgi:hypothetical protein
LVGVNTFLRPDVANMAFAIASNRVREAIDDILLRGEGASGGLKLLVYGALSSLATSVWGLKLLVYEALSY